MNECGTGFLFQLLIDFDYPDTFTNPGHLATTFMCSFVTSKSSVAKVAHFAFHKMLPATFLKKLFFEQTEKIQP